MGSRNNKPGRIVKGTAKQPTLKDASGIWSLDEAMQAHRANAWPQPNLFQPVANSLRLDSSRNTFLSKAISRSGNQRTWTWSGWFKPSKVSDAQYLFVSTNTNGNPFTYLYFSDSNFIWWEGGQTLITTAKYRDTSAWYHVVLAVDTNQSTAANRGKLYINGVQVTSFTVSNYPTQGQTTYTNSNASGLNIVYIGAAPQYVTGYLAEVNFIDGYQLDPSLLGKFDTNNTWVPIAYTGTYGTNGFYLPFTNAATSQTLGYDASVNGTTTYDADQDPYRGSVALHLTGNGPAGGNNNVFADSGPNNYAISKTASPVATSFPAQGSFSPFPLNTNTPYNPAVHGASAYFPGSNTTLTSTVPAFGTGNFTIEFWYYPTDLSGTNRNVLDNRSVSSGDSTNPFIRSNSSNGAQLCIVANSATQYAVTPTLTVNTWQHVAFVRTSGSVTSYVNGVAGATSALTTNFTSTALLLGGFIDTQASPYGTTAYISSLRITPAAVYTAAFTPTMRPFGTLTNNLITFSEDFSNASWTIDGTGATSVFNASVAPDGTPSATLAREGTSASGGARTILTSPWSTLSATTFTFSMYVKRYGQKRNIFMLAQESANAFYAHFDIVAGTVVNASASGTGTYTSSGITDAGNGWFRIWITGRITSSAIYTMVTGEAVGSTGFGAGAYTGDGSSGYLVWGAQLETASTPSNYTPTPANYSTAPSLLLNFANAAVVDTASAQNLLTASGATITSASKYGSGALTFNGSTDYLNGSVGYTFGANDWTIEGWISSRSDGNVIRFNQFNIAILVSSGTLIYYITSNGSGWNIASGLSFSTINMTSAGGWYHFALVRNKGAITPYLNGRAGTSCSIGSSAIGGDGGFLRIATEQTGFVGGFGGQLDDVRITQGVARYTADFAPPSRALPETGGKSFVTTNINAGVVKSFTTTGTTSWTAPSDVTQVEVLVVAAGGTGASDSATNVGNGGGGGGGVIYNSAYPVTPGQTYTVTVGAGQVGLYANTQRSGGNSVFGNLVAVGGGGGGYYSNNSGATGGSGGGGGATSGGAGGGTAGQGFAGGAGSSNAGGGGGGAGGPASGTNSRDGGLGLQFGISGTPTFYAGGGGGSASSGSQGTGGIGGGGAAGTVGTNGTANTGGGGGAQINGGAKSGDGGSGIVVVRYTTTAVGNSSDATTDNLVDSPTLYGHDYGNGGEVVGNYATWNALLKGIDVGDGTATFSNGNLTAKGGSSTVNLNATIALNPGKYYWEILIGLKTGGMVIGVAQPGVYTGLTAWRSDRSGSLVGSASSAYGVGSITSGALDTTWSTGDLLGIAFDTANGTAQFFKNGVSVFSITWTPTSGAYYTPFVQLQPAADFVTVNFGQRPWAYTPPAGFNAITTKNLPRLTVGSAAATPNQYFDAVTYTGTAATQTITLPGAFQPDLVWFKNRGASQNHHLMDVNRGGGTLLYANLTNTEDALGTSWANFTSTGFSLGASAGVNTSANTYVAWCWKAGGAAVSNTAGAITSQVSANTASGFSIVTFTGTGVAATVGHGLGTALSMVTIKQRNGVNNWPTWHTGLTGGNGYYVYWDSTNGLGTSSTVFNGTNPTSSVFSVGTNSLTNGSTNTYVAYCWAEIAGFSKFGTYIGNASTTDGAFIYCGFRPRFVMIKDSTNSATQWHMMDSARNAFNPVDARLMTNLANAENAQSLVDFTSTGFKIRDPNGVINTSAANLIYMAFAEKPFGNVNGTAR